MKRKNVIVITVIILALGLPCGAQAQDYGVTDVQDVQNILPHRERAQIMNQWLKWRLENILPDLMRRENIDMWVVICREANEGPVYFSLTPKPSFYASRTTILVFHDRGKDQGVERFSSRSRGGDVWYRPLYKDRNLDAFQQLAEFVRDRNPRRIGINRSDDWSFGDGLSAALLAKLEAALGSEYASRLVTAEKLCVGWLETRSPQELSVYRHICGIAHDIIAEFFSNQVIAPDVTTTEDVVWWFRDKVSELKLSTWFQPSVSIIRSDKDTARYGKDDHVIRRGDLLHCDVGIIYLGLYTDTQQHAYVCRIGEADAPEGLKAGLRQCNRLQDIFMQEFKAGRSGNDILRISLQKAKAEGLKPMIYTHPLGVYGHAAGPTIGRYDKQEGIAVRGDYPLYANTCYAIELNNRCTIPEWGGQEIAIMLEEDGVFTADGCDFIDGRMEQLYLIK